MGADFCATHTPTPRWREQPVEKITPSNVESVWEEFVLPVVRERVVDLLAHDLERWREELWPVLDDDEEHDDQDATRLLTEALVEHARVVFDVHWLGSREVGWFLIDNVPNLVTGGMSWGDPPTECYDSISYVGEARIFDVPLDGPEPEPLDTAAAAMRGIAHVLDTVGDPDPTFGVQWNGDTLDAVAEIVRAWKLVEGSVSVLERWRGRRAAFIDPEVMVGAAERAGASPCVPSGDQPVAPGGPSPQAREREPMTTDTERPVTTGPISVNREAVLATFADPLYDRPMPDIGDAERVVLSLIRHDAEDHGWLDLPDLWAVYVYCETDDSTPPVLLVVVDTHERLPNGATRRYATPSFDWDEPYPVDVANRIRENGWHPTELSFEETIEVLEFVVRLANEAVAR